MQLTNTEPDMKQTYYAFFSAEQAMLTKQIVVYDFQGKVIALTLLSPSDELLFPDAVLLAQGPLEDFIFVRRFGLEEHAM